MNRFLIVLLMLVGCVTPHARQRVLLPAIQEAWPGVRADVELGAGVSVETLEEWDEAVSLGVFHDVQWPPLEASGMAGVEVRLTRGEIGVVGASVLRDRILTFGQAVTR